MDILVSILQVMHFLSGNARISSWAKSGAQTLQQSTCVPEEVFISRLLCGNNFDHVSFPSRIESIWHADGMNICMYIIVIYHHLSPCKSVYGATTIQLYNIDQIHYSVLYYHDMQL